jgi:two-component system, NarL family, nitrate/nitrite response regulator NarL
MCLFAAKWKERELMLRLPAFVCVFFRVAIADGHSLEFRPLHGCDTARFVMHNTQQPRNSAVSVVVAEANHLACELVASALRYQRIRIAVVGSAVGSHAALSLCAERQPDVVIVSAQLEDGPLQGFRVVRELRSLPSRTRAILLLGSRARDAVTDAFRCGAHGVIFRDEPLHTLTKCVQAVHKGQVWANSEQLGYLIDALGRTRPLQLHDARGIDLLSKREADVVRLVAEGLTNRAISAELGLSEHTVRNYLLKVFDKLGVSTRVELVLYCFHEGQRLMNTRLDEVGPRASVA